jgi:hypothetical protein
LAGLTAGRIPADVAADDRRDERDHPAGAVVRDGEQHPEAGQQRDVQGDEDRGRDVPQVADRPVRQPPDHARQRGQQERHGQRALAAEPGQQVHRDRAGQQRQQRRPGAGLADRAHQLPHRAADDDDE